MTANANVSLGANQTLGGDLVVNALDASGGNVGITMASHKLTVSSGVVQAQIPSRLARILPRPDRSTSERQKGF